VDDKTAYVPLNERKPRAAVVAATVKALLAVSPPDRARPAPPPRPAADLAPAGGTRAARAGSLRNRIKKRADRADRDDEA
jgi:hypothetical protein